MRTRTETINASDGAFDAYIWLPDKGTGPGILLLQEIFGVGPYIEKVAHDLSELGYVVAAPELFWRIHRHWRGDHSEEGINAALKLSRRFDFTQGVTDAALTLTHLRTLPEVTGGVGSVGMCLGGSLNYALARNEPMDAVVSFYGSAVPNATEHFGEISSPMLLVFGGNDPYIPRDRVAVVEEAAKDKLNVEVYVAEQAGHAFHNNEAPMFYHPQAAAAAWSRTVDFLTAHLPVAA